MGVVDAIQWACILCGHHIQNDWVSNKSTSNFVFSLHIPLWKLLRWFRRPTVWATGDWQLHRNTLARASHLVQSFLVKHQITQVTQPPYSPDLVPCNFCLFPKLKSPLKGRDFRPSLRFRKIQRGSWWRLGELCEVPRAYFEGDWGIIGLCTMFLVSCIFNKILYFSYCISGYLLDRPHIQHVGSWCLI